MPSYTYFQEEPDSRHVCREDIDASESLDDLQEWFDGLEETRVSIEAQLAARIAVGIEDDDWVFAISRVLMFVNMGQKQIKRRMRALGFEPDPRAVELTKLKESLTVRKAQAAFGEAFQEAARKTLSEADFLDIWNEALGAMPPSKVEARQ